MDFDPRDYDSRDDQRLDTERSRGGRGASAEHDGEGHRTPHDHPKERHQDSRELGRGPGDARQSNHSGQDSRDDARWPERERKGVCHFEFERMALYASAEDALAGRDDDAYWLALWPVPAKWASLDGQTVIVNADFDGHFRGHEAF